MEKIIFLIIILNIIASIYAKKQKQKRLQEAARKKAASKNPDQERSSPSITLEPSPNKGQRRPEPANKPLKKRLETGKGFLKELMKELGVEVPEQETQVFREKKPAYSENIITEEPDNVILTSRPEEKTETAVEDPFTKPLQPDPLVGKKSNDKVVRDHPIISQLNHLASVKSAFILKTILDQPKAYRHRRSRH